MDKKVPILAITVAVIISVIFSSAAVIIADHAMTRDSYNPASEKYTLYVGTELEGDALEECQVAILQAIVQDYTTGYTSYLAKGCSVVGTETIPADGTIVIVIGWVEPGATWIEDITERIMELEQVKALLVEKTKGDYQIFVPTS